MPPKPKRGEPLPPARFSFHMGSVLRRYLTRCQSILADDAGPSRVVSSGEVLRVALRLLLLRLLGQRADPGNQHDPVWVEYLEVLDHSCGCGEGAPLLYHEGTGEMDVPANRPAPKPQRRERQ